MTKDKALRMALEALEYEPIGKTSGEKDLKDQAITAIKEALAQPEHDPAATIAVRWHEPVGKVAFVLDVTLPVGIHKVYAAPPQRTWVGLTWEEIDKCFKITPDQYLPAQIYRRIEEKLKEKNT